MLRSDKFAVTAELSPPDFADAEEVYTRARLFDGYVDAMNVTDGSGANCRMSSVGLCSLLTRIDYATIMQMSCRDRNRLAMQGDVLGAAAMGAANILCLTGDGVWVSGQPEAKPVFDLDCMSLLSTVRMMRDQSCLLSGRQLTSPPKVFLGATANPILPPRDFRPIRLAKKIKSGAEFVQTQYCFDLLRLKHYMTKVVDLGLHEECFIPVWVGLLASAKVGVWIRGNVPGVHIPDCVIGRLASSTRPRQEGKRICMEQIQKIREVDGVSGVHVMAYRQEEAVAEIVDASGVLERRVAWYPGQIQGQGTDFSRWAII